MSKRIAIVTGGAGFIGSHMVDLLLDQGFAVRAIDNLSTGRKSNVEHRLSSPHFTLDTRDLRSLSPQDSVFKDTEYVFHFGGLGDIVPSIEKPTDYMSVNIMGTVHALEGARHARVKKFVYAASSSCYGLAEELPTTESAKLSPEYPYALSKLLGEQSALHWHKVYGLPVNSIRMFNIYGPRVRTTGAYGAVFGVFLKQKLAGKPFTIVGDGTQTRDFVFVTDVARAFLASAESSYSGEIYNLGASEAPKSVNRLVDLIGGPKVYVPKRPGEPDCTWADTRKITTHLKWKPTTSFEEGVAMMLKHIQDWQDAPLWDVESIKTATRTWFATMASRESK